MEASMISMMNKFRAKSQIFQLLWPKRKNGRPMKRRTWKKRHSRELKELKLECKRARHRILQELDKRGWYLDYRIGNMTQEETR